MGDVYGLLAIPAPTQDVTDVLTDPALEILLDFFRRVMIANVATAWGAFAPGEPIVRNAYARDPQPADFSDKELPALYCWRDSHVSEWAADCCAQDTSDIVLMWVYPPGDQFKQAIRMAVQNGLVKALHRAIYYGRDPAWLYEQTLSTTNAILNGTFATPTDWTTGTGWAIAGGSANAGAATSLLSQPNRLTLTKRYRVTFTVSAGSTGYIRAVCGGTNGTQRTGAGTYTEDILCDGTTTFALQGTGFTGSVDNVTVYQYYDVDGSSARHGSLLRAACGFCRPIMPDRPFARAAELIVQMTDGQPIKYPAIRFGVTVCEELSEDLSLEDVTAYTIDVAEDGMDLYQTTSP